MRKRYHVLRVLPVFLLLALVTVPGGLALAEGATAVGISGPDEVNPGEQFTVDIRIEPGEAIAGVQFSLAFDASLFTVDSITEGDLLSQNGASTYFGPGTIDNVSGSISGVAGVTTTPGQVVSDPGTFAVITLTASTSGGTSPLTLSNVILGDINGQPVQVEVTSGQVTVTSDASAPSTLTPTGGGGGGGGALGITYLTEYITVSGKLTDDVTAPSADAAAELSLPRYTLCLNRVGMPLQYVSFQVKNPAPDPPEDARFVGPVYDISPDGSTFEPPLHLSFYYNENAIPEGVAEKNLVVATYDSDARQWQHLEYVVNPDGNVITAEVTHFSVFAVLAYTHPASFEVTDLSITPAETDLGESVDISAVVTNIGDLTGSYELVLALDDVRAQTREITLEGGDSKTVSFSVIPEVSGECRASIGELSALFTVREPKATEAITATPPNITPDTGTFNIVATDDNDIAITGLDIVPVYSDQTGNLVSVRIGYRIDNAEELPSNAKLVIKVFYEDELLEELPSLSISQLEPDNTVSLSYIPALGWETGLYTFQSELYQDEGTLYNTVQCDFEVRPESVTKVVSLKLLGMVIGAALTVTIVLVALVIYHRRDMLRSNV